MDSIEENPKTDGVFVVFQNFEENQIFIYDQQATKFVSVQTVKSSQIYESLTRKTGYKTCSNSNLILSSAFLSNFDLFKVSKKNGLLQEVEGLLSLATTDHTENYILTQNSNTIFPLLDPNEIATQEYKFILNKSFTGAHDWEDLIKNTYFIEDINIIKKEMIYTISLLHRQYNKFILTAFQLDIDTNDIISYRCYEDIKSEEAFQSLLLPIEDPYLKYISKAQSDTKKIPWIGWASVSSNHIQFIHDDKYDLIELK